MKKYWVIFFLIVTFGMTDLVFSQPVKIEAHRECPLCGMYPARYPRFNCQIVFKDGRYEAFDSAIGLMVYLLCPENTGAKLQPVEKIYFKDYLKKSWIEADNTFFVTGSQIVGPMGVEFLPADSLEAAKALKKQEKGQNIVHFKEINRQYMVKAAKGGWLHYLAKKMVLK